VQTRNVKGASRPAPRENRTAVHCGRSVRQDCSVRGKSALRDKAVRATRWVAAPQMYDPTIHHRRSIRLRGYDYASPGMYYVTVCAADRRCAFGEIIDGQMRRNHWGDIVYEEWYRTAKVRPGIELDAFVVMPNHVHGIIKIGRGDPAGRPYDHKEARLGPPSGSPVRMPAPHGPAPGSVGAIVGQVKSIVRKRINRIYGAEREVVWQRNYYEHVIRNEKDLFRIREYILNNPLTWSKDSENPANLSACEDDIEGICG